MLLRQNTAVTIHVGPGVATDGVKTVTTLVASKVTAMQIVKHGWTATTQTVTGRTFSHMAHGHYRVNLTSTDCNTLGMLKFFIRSTGTVKALPMWHHYLVVPANVYDSLVSGTTKLQTDVRKWVGSTVTGPTATGRIKVDLRTWIGTAPLALSTSPAGKVHALVTRGSTGGSSAAAAAAQTDRSLWLRRVDVRREPGK